MAAQEVQDKIGSRDRYLDVHSPPAMQACNIMEPGALLTEQALCHDGGWSLCTDYMADVYWERRELRLCRSPCNGYQRISS